MKLAVIALALLGAAQLHADEMQTFQKADRLTIKNIQGVSEITASPDANMHVAVEKIAFSDKCTLKVVQTGTAVETSVENTAWIGHGDDCRANIRVQTPGLKSLTIDQTSGTVAVKEVKGDVLDVRSVSADVDVQGGFAKSTVKSVSGKIAMKAAASSKDILVKSISGRLDLDTATHKPKIEMVTVSGAAFLKATPPPQVTFKSVSGHLEAKASGTADGAPVEFKSVSGSLTVQ